MIIGKKLRVTTIWFVIVTLIITMIVPVQRVDALVDGDWEYDINHDGTVTITLYMGGLKGWPVKDMIIPSKIAGRTVTSIGQGAFAHSKLNSVTIPNTVKTIDAEAFFNSEITKVEIPDSVTEIRFRAFDNTKLTNVEIPNSVISIGDHAFAESQLTSVEIPNSVTTLGNGVFTRNKLTSVNIPNSVTSIGDSTFAGNELSNVEIPNSVESIGNAAFANNQLTSITIPNSVTSLGDSVFRHNKLTNVTISNRVTSLGVQVFMNNELKYVEIPTSVTKIGAWAFAQNNNLTSVEISNSVEMIEEYAFYQSKLTSVTIPKSVTSIGDNAFEFNQLTKVKVENDKTTFGKDVFANNLIEPADLTIVAHDPSTAKDYALNNGHTFKNVIDTPENAFDWHDNGDGTVTITDYNGTLKDVEIPNRLAGLEVTGIEDRAFYDQQLTRVTIPESVTSIGEDAFRKNKLVSIVIPSRVTTIGNTAFADNNLKVVTLLNDSTSIGEQAFVNNQPHDADLIIASYDPSTAKNYANQMNYTFIDISATDEQDYEWANNGDGTATITKYKGQAKDIEIPEIVGGLIVTAIGKESFMYKDLTSTTIPESVIRIEERAFYANQMTKIDFPKRLINIGQEAFAYNNLTTIVIPSSVTTIGKRAFTFNKLTNVKVFNDSTTFGSDVFANNQIEPAKLTIIAYDPSTSKDYADSHQHSFVDIMTLPENIFQWTDNGDGTVTITGYNGTAKDIVIPDTISGLNVTSIDDESFYNQQLTTVTIPNSVTHIGTRAFSKNELERINLPSSLKSIGAQAFRENKLTGVIIPESVTSIGNEAFANNYLKIVKVLNNSVIFGEQVFHDNQLDATNLILVGHDPSTTKNVAEQSNYTFKDLSSLREADYKWSDNGDGTATITDYIGQDKDITIPEIVGLLIVTEIGNHAFLNDKLTSVVIPDTVIKIGESAFTGNLLTSLVIPNHVTSIGANAFSSNQLTSIQIPESIMHIEDGVFRKNALTSVDIPNSVTSIGKETFAYNDLTEILIPSNVSSIDNGAFSYNRLTTVTVLNDATTFGSFVFSANQAEPTNLTLISYDLSTTKDYADSNQHSFVDIATLPENIFQWKVNDDETVTITGYNGTAKNIVIPDTISGLIVTRIEDEAFYNQQLTNVTIPNSVTRIGTRAFSKNELERITLPSSLKSIGAQAFRENKLTRVVIPESVTSIGKEAFANNYLKIVKVLNNSVIFGEQVFHDNQLDATNLILVGHDPSTTKNVAEQSNYTFKDLSSLREADYKWSDNGDGTATITDYIGQDKDITIPEIVGLLIVTEIGNHAFSSNNLTSVKLPDTVITIGESAFYMNQLTSLVIPEGVTRIGKEAFSYNSLQDVTIPKGITRIEESTFSNNKLTNVIISENVESIRDSAFQHNELRRIEIRNKDTVISENAFLNNHYDNSQITMIGYDPSTAKDHAHRMGFTFVNIATLPENAYQWENNGDGTATITAYNGIIKDAKIPEKLAGLTVTAIGNNVFYNQQLTSVTIPNSVKHIGTRAFAKNELEQITIPNGVTSVGDDAFRENKLTGVIIPESVTSIGKEAFANNQLKVVKVLNNSVLFGEQVFHGNQFDARSLILIGHDPSTTKNVAEKMTYTFIDLVSLHEEDYQWIDNGDGTAKITKYIGTNKELEIPKIVGLLIVSSIGEEAFRNKRLNSVTIPNTVKEIGTRAFSGNELTSVIIPEGVTNIKSNAFAYNKLANVTFPKSLTEIGELAFYANPLTSVIIPDNVATIGENAFRHNQLRRIEIRNKDTIISATAFSENQYDNSQITMIGYDPSTAKDHAHHMGFTFVDIATLPENAYQWVDHGDGTATIKGYNGKVKNLEIPETLAGLTITGIAERAFYNQQLRVVSIPNSVTTIGDEAFANNDLKYVKILNAGVHLGDRVFHNDQSNAADVTLIAPDPSTTKEYAEDYHHSFKDLSFFREVDYEWEDNGDGTATITKYHGKDKDIVIPEIVGALIVTNIGKDTFRLKELTSATIPDTITTIGEMAFFDNQLTSVTIPDTVTSIERNAFGYNRLTTVTIPKNLTKIEEAVFSNNALKEIVIPNNIVQIRDNAFRYNQLTKIEIRNKDTVISVSAFSNNHYDNSQITMIGHDPSTAKDHAHHMGFTFVDIATLPESAYQWVDHGDGTATIKGYNGKVKNLEIPETLAGLTITGIAERAFYNQQLRVVSIPNSVTTIGDEAFASNDLKYVKILNTGVHLGDRVFHNDQSNAADVTLIAPDPSTTKEYAEDYHHSFKDLSFFREVDYEWEDNGDGTATITKYHGKDKDIVIPEIVGALIVTNIGKEAFRIKELTSVTIPDTITTIGEMAFYGNKLTSVTIPDTVTSIERNAFRYNRLTTVTIPKNITQIEDGVFNNNELKNIEIPNHVTSIGNEAFYGNDITSITIPHSVAYIGEWAFAYNRLTSVIVFNDSTEFESFVFEANYPELTLIGHDPSTTKNYANSHGYAFVDIMTLPESAYQWTNNGDGTATITEYIGKNSEVIIPDTLGELTVTTIGNRAFSNKQLTSVVLPSRVVNIEDYAFSHNQLEHIELGEEIAMIGDYAFTANQLTNVVIRSKGAVISPQAFTDNQDNPAHLTLIGYDPSTAKDLAHQYGYTFLNGEGQVTFSQNGHVEWEKSHSTSVDVLGYNESESLQYVWSTSTETPTNGWMIFSNGSTLETPVGGAGVYYLHIKGIGLFGNDMNVRSEAFNIDNVNPDAPTIHAPTTWQNREVIISITAGADEHSGVDSTFYRVNNGAWETYVNSMTINANGETTIEAKTFDNVGNESTITKATVKVDTEKPSLSITPSTTEETHEDVELTIQSVDQISGVKRIQDADGHWHSHAEIIYTVKQNGTYTFIVEDYAGNQTTESITVSNIKKALSLEIPTISKLENVTLRQEQVRYTADLTPLKVKDWRTDRNDWRIDVSASPLKMVNEDYELPFGTLQLKPITNIEQISGNDNLPRSTLVGSQAIDGGKVTLLASNDSRGEFVASFPQSAFELWLDPISVRIDDPFGTTYETTVTWELIEAP